MIQAKRIKSIFADKGNNETSFEAPLDYLTYSSRFFNEIDLEHHLFRRAINSSFSLSTEMLGKE